MIKNMNIHRSVFSILGGLSLAALSCTKTNFIDETESSDSHGNIPDTDMTDNDAESDAETSGSNTSSDDTETPTDDAEVETVCGTLASGDRDITADPRIDGFFRAVLNLQDELEYSIHATAAIMRKTAEDFDVPQEDRSMTEWAEALVEAIETDIEAHTTSGLFMDGNWYADAYMSESSALEAEAWCENALGCDCDIQASNKRDEITFACEGRCGNDCTCSPDDSGCEYDDVCERSCIGALTPSVCDTACDLGAGCGLQAAVQSVVPLNLTQILGSGFIFTYKDTVVNMDALIAFRARMDRFYESLQDVYGESIAVRTRFDNGFANARCFDCSVVYIRKSIEDFSDRLVRGALPFEVETGRLVCAVSAFAEASKLLADMTISANRLIDTQSTLLGVPIATP